MACGDGVMETLFAIGMMVGLMKPHKEPPRPLAPVSVVRPVPVDRRDVARREAQAERPGLRQKNTWALDY